MGWDYRKFGTPSDPIRQSALGAIAGQNGCAKRYFYERQDDAAGVVRTQRHYWKGLLGTAGHAVLERALTRAGDEVLAGRTGSLQQIQRVLEEEIRKATRTPEELAADVDALAIDPAHVCGGDASRVDWGDERNPSLRILERAHVIREALREVGRRAEIIVAVEAPFTVQIDEYHCMGTIDLVYIARDTGALVLVDWKFGDMRMPDVVRDYGYQFGVYAAALEHGTLWPGTDRARTFGVSPAEIYVVQLADYVPVLKARKVLDVMRAAQRPLTSAEVGDHTGLGGGSGKAMLGALRKLGYVENRRAGKASIWVPTPREDYPRGDDAWHRSARQADDEARLIVSIKNIVRSVRMGIGMERLGEQCGRCPYKAQCLGEGYVAKDEQREFATAMREAGVTASDDYA